MLILKISFSQNGLHIALDEDLNEESVKEIEVKVRPKRNVKPIQRLSPNAPTPPPSTAPEPINGKSKCASYEVDWNLTKELHESLSLGIVRDQLKASSKDRASKQLNGLDKKHPAAICGVLCKDVANDVKGFKDHPTPKDPPLMVRLKCFPKVSSRAQSPALSPVLASPNAKESPVKEAASKGSSNKASPSKESSNKGSPEKECSNKGSTSKESSSKGSPGKGTSSKGTPSKGTSSKGTPNKVSLSSPENETSSKTSDSEMSSGNKSKPEGKVVRTRGRSRSKPNTFSVVVSKRGRGGKLMGRPRLHHNRVGYINSEGFDYNSGTSTIKTRGGHPRMRGPGVPARRGRSRGRPSSIQRTSVMESEQCEDQSPSPAILNGSAPFEEAEAMEVDKSDTGEKSEGGGSSSFREPLPQRRKRGRLPKRFSETASSVAPSGRGRGRRRGRGRGAKRESVGMMGTLHLNQDESEGSDIMQRIGSSSAVPSPGSSGKTTVSSSAEPVPCEICEQVNKQRPVFYFHGHQVCRVCSNFLTSTLRKLESLADAACIYRNTCNAEGRYCRACRLLKFLHLGFDLPKFSKMRGYPSVVGDLSIDALALPSVVHQARLDRFSEYAKFLENWRSEHSSTLEFAEFTPIPPVTRTPPPPVTAPPPVKHRRPVWHEEESEEEEEEEDKSTDNEFGFDSMRAIRLADGKLYNEVRLIEKLLVEISVNAK